jgi:hypothetical protein
MAQADGAGALAMLKRFEQGKGSGFVSGWLNGIWGLLGRIVQRFHGYSE